MMNAYEPFLLPLDADDPQQAGAATSPIDEERVLAGRYWEVDWDLLAEGVRARYGLILLTGISETAHCRRLPEARDRESPRRALVLEDGENKWLLMEHPALLAEYDTLAGPEQRLALARPSLFTRLWRAGAVPGAEVSGMDPEKADATLLMRQIERLLAQGRPSDWHLEPRRDCYISRVRNLGRLSRPERLQKSKGEWLVRSLLTKAGLKSSVAEAQDGGFALETTVHPLSVRLSSIPAVHGQAVVLRFLYRDDDEAFRLEKLGLPDALIRELGAACETRDGLWLVAGPTGSGKSTTLHALLKNSVDAGEKILAVEDPVERAIPGVHHLAVGSPPGLTFGTAVRAFLRQSPDCVLIGEIRDADTAAVSIQAARTGHRVLSTVHARDDRGLARRFADLGQDHAALKSVLRVILHQRLVPMLCPACRESHPFPARLLDRVQSLGLGVPRQYASAEGCPLCNNGFISRRGLYARGSVHSPVHTRNILLEEAWQLFCRQETAVSSLMPFLEPRERPHFQICQR